MYSLLSIAYITLSLTAIVLSSPTPNVQKRSFFHTVSKARSLGIGAGPNAMAAAYRKFNWDLPAGMSLGGAASKAVAGQSGAVSATPEQNAAEYLSPVTIGGQTLNLDFDTGSSDLWVFSTALPASSIGAHTAFNPAKSNTFKTLQGATWQISYGDGSMAAGTVGTDTVVVGGATATGQAVELATAVSSSFVQDANNDGLLGLAFSNLNTVKPQKQNTFFQTIMPTLAQPVFSVDLSLNASGTYTFGAIDNTKYTGQLTTIPLSSNSGFWQVDSNSFQVGNQKIVNQGASPAIADTGTSLLLVDAQVASTYYSQVRGAKLDKSVGGYVYPCSSTLPNFGVALGNYMAIIPGNMITFAQADATNCFGGIQTNSGGNLQIYGDVMFRAQYVVFNGGTKSLQMAPKK